MANRIIPVVIAALTLGALPACSGMFGGGPKPVEVQGEAPTAGADATIRAAHDANRRITSLQIDVEHLAPPERIREGATAYVVWAKAQGGDDYERLGNLRYDPKDRSGTLEATTTSRDFEILVTAEALAEVPQPTGDPVFQRSIAAE